MAKFTVGDKIRLRKGSTINYCTWVDGDMDKEVGRTGTIIDVGTNYQVSCSSWFWAEEWLELVEEETLTININPSTRMFIDELVEYKWEEDYKPKQSIMSKITTFAKNLVLSADEKLLRKYGLHDECGNHTDEAEELVIAKLVKENESYLVELATAMQVEEAKK